MFVVLLDDNEIYCFLNLIDFSIIFYHFQCLQVICFMLETNVSYRELSSCLNWPFKPLRCCRCYILRFDFVIFRLSLMYINLVWLIYLAWGGTLLHTASCICVTVYTKKEVLCLFFDFVEDLHLFLISGILFLIFKMRKRKDFLSKNRKFKQKQT